MKRSIIMGGREIVIDVLGQPIDAAFDRLHAAYFGQLPLPWEEFEAAALDFFDRTARNWNAHDDYFNNFTVIWRTLLDAGRYEHSERIWQSALQPALKWEQMHQPQRIHKGTPYYFWSMTALLRGDLDRGYLLIHQAVREDIDNSGQSTPNTPGYALVSLNYNRVDQAFRQWVLLQAEFLNKLLDNYNTTYTRSISLEDVKHRFLDAAPSIETLFLLTYTIARLMGLSNVPGYATLNPFAGQLELNILFDVALVIDSAIKAKNPTQWRFIHHAEHLLRAVGHALTHEQLGEVNGQFENAFDATVQSALEGNLMLPGGTILDRVQSDIAICYGLRNNGAHNIGTASIIWNRYPEVQQAVFRTLFAVVDYIYP
jgi:hypothetical protein